MWASQRGAVAKRYCAVEAMAPSLFWARESTPNLSARGRCLILAMTEGMRAGRSVAKCWMSCMTGGRRDDEEERESEEDGENQSDDGEWAGGRPVADVQAHDVLHERHEDDGEERADVDDLEDLAETPGEREAESEREGEEDVAADGGDLLRVIVGGIGVVRLQRQRARSPGWLYWMLSLGCGGAQPGWLVVDSERGSR